MTDQELLDLLREVHSDVTLAHRLMAHNTHPTKHDIHTVAARTGLAEMAILEIIESLERDE